MMSCHSSLVHDLQVDEVRRLSTEAEEAADTQNFEQVRQFLVHIMHVMGSI